VNIIERILDTELVQIWQQQLSKPLRQLITGLSGSAKTLLMAGALQQTKKKIVIAVPNLYYANQLVEDLRNVLSENEVYLFPVDEVLSAEMAFSSPEARAERVAALDFLSTKNSGVIVVPVAGLRRFLPDQATWEKAHLSWEIGTEIEPETVAQQLVLMGYERQPLVAKPGEFSLRGSIIDVYPLNSEYPVRAELFDVEIDSLRYFEADTQRSVSPIEKVNISPMTDLVYSDENLKKGALSLQKALKNV
jgi:transcription-repair coupling factor (superfamily II helicase)